ncbi:MAG TPA: spore coat U domain-containing protein [Sphingomicrobium sp.]|nr:spore coat U domain-containing protein [Sphingomicrobium sp.]
MDSPLTRAERPRASMRALALALFFVALAGQAQVGTSTFTARVSVGTSCNISTSAVAFGNYDPIVANKTTSLNAVGSVTITCVKGTAPTIALGLGNNATGSQRRMKDAVSGDFLLYELYQPSSSAAGAACSFPGSVVWGSAGANLLTATSAPSKVARSYNVCGTVSAAQNPTVGTYNDTVNATVNF